MKHFRVILAALCITVLVSGFSATTYAYGGDSEVPPTESVQPGEGFSEEGTLVTRDLLYDEHTNKQFITVQTNGGSTFYIIIDYDKPVDDGGEQYETHFLSVVDEADLMAVLESAGVELPVCECADKCMAGAINTVCPVCATNMTECKGVAPEPEPVPEAPADEPAPEQSNSSTLLLIVAVVLAGCGAVWYFKFCRPQPKATEAYDEEPDTYDDFDGDDNVPWDEDEV